MVHRQTVRQNSAFTVTKLDQFTLLAQSDHLDSQASQSICPTGYNTLHTLKETSRNIRKHTRSKERKNQPADGGLKLNAATHYTALADYTTRLPKKNTRTLHRPQLQTCHAGNHHSCLFSQQGLYPPAL